MNRNRTPPARILLLAAVLIVLLVPVGLVGSSDGVPAVGHAAAARASPTVALTGSPLSASLTASPSQLTEGQSLMVQVTATGGDPQYSYSYTGLPPGCNGQNSPSVSCNPSGTGTFSIEASVSDSGTNHTQTNSVSVTVTSSQNGNGNGNGNGNSGGNNSSGGLSSLFSGFSSILSLLLIFGIVGFATWILLIVGVWIIAITLVRRLPKRGTIDALVAGGKCAACAAPVPGGAKFCPTCGTGTAAKTA
jgi:hypothetical protein